MIATHRLARSSRHAWGACLCGAAATGPTLAPWRGREPGPPALRRVAASFRLRRSGEEAACLHWAVAALAAYGAGRSAGAAMRAADAAAGGAAAAHEPFLAFLASLTAHGDARPLRALLRRRVLEALAGAVLRMLARRSARRWRV